MPSRGVYKEGNVLHEIQMAFAIDHTGLRRGSEGVIALRDVIAAHNAANETLRELGQRHGDGGRSSPQGKGEARP